MVSNGPGVICECATARGAGTVGVVLVAVWAEQARKLLPPLHNGTANSAPTSTWLSRRCGSLVSLVDPGDTSRVRKRAPVQSLVLTASEIGAYAICFVPMSALAIEIDPGKLRCGAT
jgi:hypothetical protein